ncbi:MAG: DUF4340 domain-containing protein [Nitrospiria bacterium]
MRFKATWVFLFIFLALVSYLLLFENPKEKKEAEQKEKAEKLFDFSPDQVRQAEIYSTKGHFMIEMNPEEKWIVKNISDAGSSSVNVLADSRVVERLIQQFGQLKPIRVVEENGENLKGFGFIVPEKSVALSLKNGIILKLLIGDDAPISQTLYVKRADNAKVYLTDNTIKSIVENDLWTLRNKHLLSYDQVLIDRVEVQLPGESWELTRKGDEWILNDRPSEKINEEKLSSFLFSAGTLEGERILSEEGKNLKEYGLDTPYATLRFHIKEKTFTLLIGKMNNEEDLAALGNPPGPVFQIKKEFLKQIPLKEDLIKKPPPPLPAATSGGSGTK